MSGPLLSARTPTGSSERRPITVLFADIAGSTSIVERMDAEDWTVLVGEAFARMSRTIEHYDGTIARLMGDGVLAFFGAPVAHEDDPERAVRCGLDMVRVIDELGAEVNDKHGIELRVRVGINTGPVVVGMVGTDVAHEYTAMGDAVNVAARMQAAAPPGGVLITAATHKFVGPLVEATDAGPLELKGKAEPVHAFQVTALRAGAVSARGLGGGVHSAMIGRDPQLARLRDAFAVVRARQGRVASILGEPGIGKSRLLAELRAHAQATDPSARWIEARCLSYGRTLPYHVVLDLVRSCIGVTPTADEPEIRAALEEHMKLLFGESWSDPYTYLGHLLSIQLAPEVRARMSALAFETVKRYVSSLINVVRALSATGPVVLACEDLHWADAASVDVLSQLLPLANELPLLIVTTSRLDRESEGWRLVSSVRDSFGDALVELRLGPLSGDDTRTLVANLLRIESLPVATRDLILDKAEGNPFFVEEVIRMLIDRGAIVREGDKWVATAQVADVAIPDTLQGLLLARIDRLPAESKRTLRVAAVIGRQFGVTMLERLLEAKTSTRHELGTLEASGLVQVAALEPELEYLFRHALVQDAAYSSLLKQDRRSLHRLAAETLVALYPDRRRELAAVVALHLERAGDPAAAVEHLVTAGEHALERFANRESLSFFERAEANLRDDDPRDDLRLRAALGAAKVGWTFGTARPIERLERALARGADRADRKLVGDAYFWMVFLRRLQGERPDTSPPLKHAADRAAEIGAALGDPVAEAIPNAFVGVGMISTGNLREGARLLEEAVGPIVAHGDPLSSAILSDLLSTTYARLGEFAAAERSLAQAERLAESGDPIAALDAQIARSALLIERGEIGEGEALASTCAARSEELGAVACAVGANVIAGAAHLARDDAFGAKAPLERGNELAQVINRASAWTLAQGMLGSVRARLGDVPGGTADWNRALERARTMRDRPGEAVTLRQRARARLHATPPDHAAALADLETATTLFEEMEARPSLARALRDRAQILRALGRAADADAADERSRAIGAELGLKDFAPAEIRPAHLEG